MKSYWGRVDPLFNMTSILIRRESRDTDMHVIMEADVGMEHLQAKERQRLLENIRSYRKQKPFFL